MNDKEIVDRFFAQNREIKQELSLIEDVLKTLLVNNVLSDAEKIVSASESKSTKSDKKETFSPSNDEYVLDLQAQLDFLESKFRSLIGRECRIRNECDLLYDENKNEILISNMSKSMRNNIHYGWCFEIVDYDFSMFLLHYRTNSRNEYNYWVSFDMISLI